MAIDRLQSSTVAVPAVTQRRIVRVVPVHHVGNNLAPAIAPAAERVAVVDSEAEVDHQVPAIVPVGQQVVVVSEAEVDRRVPAIALVGEQVVGLEIGQLHRPALHREAAVAGALAVVVAV
jgi:hypothetical protein